MEIGDMIEINRGAYKHWALYIGHGDVIHLVTPDGPASPTRINNYLDDKYTPRNIDVIMKEVGHTSPYNLIGNNYKHFVTSLLFGKSEY
ncbi:phospholipase A and acyltransferase 4-like [Salvelinus sp. IW2-2015]|uniref:phospholipase A and acyltransferase 4-like n=1 Tax=Salvelinus sp. IW2-2015 TaxID=2691554 RepID=UPI0038D4BF15